MANKSRTAFLSAFLKLMLLFYKRQNTSAILLILMQVCRCLESRCPCLQEIIQNIIFMKLPRQTTKIQHQNLKCNSQ